MKNEFILQINFEQMSSIRVPIEVGLEIIKVDGKLEQATTNANALLCSVNNSVQDRQRAVSAIEQVRELLQERTRLYESAKTRYC